MPADYIALQSGERYDFLLFTNSSPTKSDYWMRAEALEIDVPEGTTPSTDPPYCLMLDRAVESILHYNMPGASLPTQQTMYASRKILCLSIQLASHPDPVK